MFRMTSPFPHHMRRRMLALALVSVGFGAACFFSRHPFVRGHLGDVAAAMLVYALVALTFRRGRLAVAAAICFAAELRQLLVTPAGPAADLVLGRHFDPIDLAAYAVGLLVALAWDSVRVRSIHKAQGTISHEKSPAQRTASMLGGGGPKTDIV
jgi:hypothetical protein